MITSPAAGDRYREMIKLLPCNECVRAITVHFFRDVNWQHTLLDRNWFEARLSRFSAMVPVSGEPNSIAFPALILELISLGLQFLPGSQCQSHKACSHDSRIYSDAGEEMLRLVKESSIDLDLVLAEFLRVVWLKNQGLVLEAWHALGQVVRDAKEIGLHRNDISFNAVDMESACEQLWTLHMKRRTMVNIFLWDR